MHAKMNLQESSSTEEGHMVDENHASYAKVGATVLFGVLAIIATLVYFGGVGDKSHVLMAETYYDAAVSGLSIGSEVNYRGVTVGSVSDISFVGSLYDDAAEEDWQKVVVTIAFDTRKFRLADYEDSEERLRYLIDKGIRATVSSSGVTGLSKLELNIPKDPAELPPISWEPRYLCIPPQPSVLESITDMITRIANDIDDMDFAAAWSNVVSAADSMAALAANLNELVDSQKGNIAEAISGINGAANSINSLAIELKENPSLLIRGRQHERLPETE